MKIILLRHYWHVRITFWWNRCSSPNSSSSSPFSISSTLFVTVRFATSCEQSSSFVIDNKSSKGQKHACVHRTSPFELTNKVRIFSPVPQELWLFHSRSEGGLWDTPASALHTCRRTNRLTSSQRPELNQNEMRLTVTVWPAFRTNLGLNL